MNQMLRHPVSADEPIQQIVLNDISWELYERLLREVADRPIRMTYDRGRLELMSPLPQHERVKSIVRRMVEQLTVELGMEVSSFGSTTYRQKDIARGLEPDESFYFKHAWKMAGRKRLNLKKDPVPELVLEVDVTHRLIAREPVYASLGMPELWRWNGLSLVCLELVNGSYKRREKSVAFPFLAPAELTQFIRMQDRYPDNSIIAKFVKWVRGNGWAKS